MGFVRLLVTSFVFPTAALLLLLSLFVAFIQLSTKEPPAEKTWNRLVPVEAPNKHTTLNGLAFVRRTSPLCTHAHAHKHTMWTKTGLFPHKRSATERYQGRPEDLTQAGGPSSYGFPETGLLSWHECIPHLLTAGYFVVHPFSALLAFYCVLHCAVLHGLTTRSYALPCAVCSVTTIQGGARPARLQSERETKQR